MSIYLGYSYSTGLTKEEEIEINKKTEKSRKEFSKGFAKGTTFSLAVGSVYLLSRSAAHAKDLPPSKTPKTAPADATGVQPASKRGFSPLSEKAKGTFTGGAGAVCLAAFQSGDFFIGFGCAILVVVAGIVITRPEN